MVRIGHDVMAQDYDGIIRATTSSKIWRQATKATYNRRPFAQKERWTCVGKVVDDGGYPNQYCEVDVVEWVKQNKCMVQTSANNEKSE